MRFFRASAAAALLVVAFGAQTVAAADPTVVRHGSREDKVVALTFDDGWSTPRCQKILQILVARDVPATFFPNALYVREHPEFWRRVAGLGFPIGNHTTNHLDLTEMTGAGVFREIDRNRRIVERITGFRMVRVMRPPFGAYNDRTIRQAAKAGFPTLLLWDTTSMDTSRRASHRAMIKAALSGRNGSIVVLHCGPKATPRILPRIIEGYRKRGFRFVTIPELLGIDTPSRFVHRPWALALHRPGPRFVAAAAKACSGAIWGDEARRTGWNGRPSASCPPPSRTAARPGAPPGT